MVFGPIGESCPFAVFETGVIEDADPDSPSQIQSIVFRIRLLKLVNNSQPLPIMLESVEAKVVRLVPVAKKGMKCPFATVAKRRVTNIVCKRNRVCQILVQAKLSSEVTCNLGNFQRVI